MAITHSRIELNFIRPDLTVQIEDDLSGLLVTDRTGSVILHNGFGAKPLQSNEVTPEGNVIRAKVHTEAGGFQRTPSRVIPDGGVSKDREVSDLAPRVKPFGNRFH